jgi:hypothetical protein
MLAQLSAERCFAIAAIRIAAMPRRFKILSRGMNAHTAPCEVMCVDAACKKKQFERFVLIR